MRASDFTEYLEKRAGCHDIYLWGAQGEAVDKMTVGGIVSAETSSKNAARVLERIAGNVRAGYSTRTMRAYDCSGLGVDYFLSAGLIKGDTTADGLYRLCEGIKLSEVREGDMVFCGNTKGVMTHVGYVVAGRYVIEAAGRDIGVVKRPISQGSWQYAGRPPFWEQATCVIARELIYDDDTEMMRGDDVMSVQQALLAAGYDCGATDGVYGSRTADAVKAFQQGRNLSIKRLGTVGKKTATALGFVWAENA